MADRGRRRRHPEQTNEEVFFELLIQIAGDLRALKTLAYWLVGLYAAGAVLTLITVVL